MLAAVMNPPSPEISWLSADINGFLKRLLAPDAANRFDSPQAADTALMRLPLPPYDEADVTLFLHGLITSEIKHTVEAIDPQVAIRAAQTTMGEVPIPLILPAHPGVSTTQRWKNLRKPAMWLVLMLLLVVGLIWSGGMRRFARTQTVSEALTVTGNSLSDADEPGTAASLDGTPKEKKSALKESEHKKFTPQKTTGANVRAASAPNVVLRLEGHNSPGDDDSASDELSDSVANPVDESVAGTAVIQTVSQKDESGQNLHGSGTLRILCRPWAYVTIDGTRVGTTPVHRHSLKAGKHTVLLENAELNYSKSTTVLVHRDRLTTVSERIDGLVSSKRRR